MISKCVLYGEGGNDKKPISLAVTFSFVSSLAFVLSLYAVPSRIRKLDRDNPTQIKWRISITFTISVLCVLMSEKLFCRESVPVSSSHLFAFFSTELRSAMVALIQVTTLYTGPISYMIFQAFFSTSTLSDAAVLYWELFLAPTVNALFAPRTEQLRWVALRNLIIAPLVEELMFRACIVPAILSTGMAHGRICAIAPLFFGVAHMHHGAVRLSKGESLQTVLIQSLFQFAYTSIFGAYAAFVYIRSRSLLAVFVAHSVCNALGLPSLAFWSETSFLFQKRGPLLALHIFGLFAFFFACKILKFTVHR